MVESFKIRSESLKRYVKISIDLPKEYNYNNLSYPVIFVFDGQLFYNFLTENTRVIEMDKIVHQCEKQFICVTIQSPTIPEWRMSELNPYYNGDNKDVDTVLSLLFFEYVNNEILGYIKKRYRTDGNYYLLGYKEGAIAAMYMLYNYDSFKGAGLFSIALNNVSNRFKEDLLYSYTSIKDLYLIYGGLNTDTKDDDLFYKLCTQFDSLKPNKLKYDFYVNEDNSYDILKNHLLDYFNFILP